MMFIGSAIFFVGLFFVLWTRYRLTSCASAGGGLIIDGPFSVVRHPMYTGWNIMNIGLCLISFRLGVMILALFQLLVFYSLICEEDKANRKLFGKNYMMYIRIVPKTNLVKGLYLRCFRERRYPSIDLEDFEV